MRKFTLLKTRKAETLPDEIAQIQKRITERAYDLFRNRGAALGAALNDWLVAERQTIWKPPVEVCQKDNQGDVNGSFGVSVAIRNTWEHFAHGADAGVRGIGPTKEAAFEQIGRRHGPLAVDS